MPKSSNQKATPLSGFDFLKKLGIGRVKRVDPVDSDLQPVQKGQVIGIASKDRPEKVEKTVIDIPYSSVISSEAATRRDGTAVKSRYGQDMSRIVIRLPRKMELDGYSMDGLRVEIINPDKYLERAEKTGILQAAFNDSRPLKLSGFKDGRAIELTVGQDKIGEFLGNLEKCCEGLINIPTGRDIQTAERGNHAKPMGKNRESAPQPVDKKAQPTPASDKKGVSDEKRPLDGQFIGTKNLAKEVKFDNPKVVIPYENILASEPMSDKHGKVKTNRYGQVLNLVTISVPDGVEVGGYSLEGFTTKVVVVDKYLDSAADKGLLQIMFNSRFDLKLSRVDGDDRTYVTIGRDKVGEFAKSLREKSGSILENDEKKNNKDNKKYEESLDEMMSDKKEEAFLVAARTAERKTSDRGTVDR